MITLNGLFWNSCESEMHHFLHFLHRVTGCCCISIINAAVFHANRNVIFKISILSILCHYWMQVVANKFSVCFTLMSCPSSRSVWLHSGAAAAVLSLASPPQCWESMVGQALYRLVFFDFLFLMLGSFFGEFLRKWVYLFLKVNKVPPCHHGFSSAA